MSSGERQRIRVLDDHVINQIAAGEVVERPASVVKELVENALDAGASQISVEYAEGGKAMVRVADDGEGMTRTEQRAALVRHATSKLVDASELDELTTMGFRGEALPSIAAVSQFTMVSRSRGERDPTAWQLVVRGGTIESETEVGAPVGTVITVRNLLFNMPARQKFMKGDGTEAGHIIDTVTKLALANPSVRFRLRHNSRNNKRTSIDVPGNQSVPERVGALLGAKVGSHLIRQTAAGGPVEVELFIAPTQFVQKSTKAVQLFVGRRPVRDRGLLHAVMAGFGDLLGKGQFPTVVAYIEAAGGEVDYNVHPQKLEVRFADPAAVYAVVRGAIEQAIARVGWKKRETTLGDIGVAAQTVSATVPRPTRAAERLARYAASKRTLGPSPTNSPSPLDSVPSLFRNRLPATGSRLTTQPRVRKSSTTTSTTATATATATGSEPYRQTEASAERAVPPRELAEAATHSSSIGSVPSSRGYIGRLRYLGQLDLTYLVCEGDGELVLIDQHLAHEHVEFCRLRRLALSLSIPMQRMLLPRLVKLPASSVMAVRRAEETAKAVGFEMSAQSATSVAVLAAPTMLNHARIDKVVSDMLEAIATSADELGSDDAPESHLEPELGVEPRDLKNINAAVAAIACHVAIGAGESLEAREAQALLANLDAQTWSSSRGGADTVSRSHRRPLLLRMQTAELALKFLR